LVATRMVQILATRMVQMLLLALLARTCRCLPRNTVASFGGTEMLIVGGVRVVVLNVPTKVEEDHTNVQP
jgi:hypothetical protein